VTVIKLCLFGDLHLKTNDPLGSMKDGVNTRMLAKLDKLDIIKQIAIENNCTATVELGDTFDRINPPDTIRNLYATKVRSFLDTGMQYIRILGNHETTGTDQGGAGLDTAILVGKNDLYKVVNTPEFYEFKVAGGPLPFLFIPEVNLDRINKALSEFPDTFVLGHFAVEGTQFPNGRTETDGIKRGALAKRPGTLLGHIHNRQQLFKGKVHYIGAVARADFGDREIDTGVAILRIDTGKDNAWSVEYVPIPDVQLLDFRIEEGGTYSDNCFNDFEAGAIIKLTYRGSKAWYMGQDTAGIKGHILKNGAAKVYIRFQSTDTAMQEVITEKTSLEELIEKKANVDKQDPTTGLTILRKANEL